MADEKKGSKILEVIGDVFVILIMIVSVLFTIITLTSAKSENGVPNLFGYMPLSVQSDSMEPVFYKGDLLIDKPYDGRQLEVGDIVTFRAMKDGEIINNTHRIIEVHEFENFVTYTTKGDNAIGIDITEIGANDIIGVYSYASEGGDESGIKVNKLGTAIDVIKGTGEAGEKWSITIGEGSEQRILNLSFLVFVIVPLALIFLFQIYKFIKTLNEVKREKMMEEVVANNAELSEELKQKAIEEYLAKQAEEEQKKKAEEELKKKAVEEYLAKQAAEEASKAPADADNNSEN